MNDIIRFDRELIARYDRSGPRYTSYPTAMQFHHGFRNQQYRENARHSNEYPIPSPLSLYFHLPFCSHVCFYCGCNRIITKNRDHTIPYLDHLKKEIALQGRLFDRDRRVMQLHWGGGTPTYFTHGQMQDLMREINNHFTLAPDDEGDYSIEIDPRETGELTLAMLRGIGFNRISVGVQDFNPAVQKAVNRIQSVEQTADVVATAREQRYRSLGMDLIYGLPRQSVATFRETLQTVVEMDPDRISVYNYAHLPRRFKMQRRINAAELPSPAVKLEMLEMIIESLTGAGYLYIGMDHFARADNELAAARDNGTLCRNFQGYSTHGECDIIGMGITAISRIDDCYAQNIYAIGEYQELVRAGVYPVFRGIRLDRDDQVRRDVIMRLACYFRIDFETVGDTFLIDFDDYFYNELELLKHMQDDGLVLVEPDCITVTPAGRLLVRNICGVFDKYLPSGDQKLLYSKVI